MEGLLLRFLLLSGTICVFVEVSCAAKWNPKQESEFATNGFEGPFLIEEPNEVVEFSNMTGIRIQCKATGYPTPTISWLSSDGLPVNTIPDLRIIHSDGSIEFTAFRAEDFRQDVHSVVYKCLASNSVGSVISRDIKVVAVILQHYEAHVYDSYVIHGNDAVVLCHIPSFLENYINPVSWIRDHHYIINNRELNEDNKYIILSDGNLFIRQVQNQDQGSSFKCKTHNRLTNITKISSSFGKIFVTDPETNMKPRIMKMKQEIMVFERTSLVIPCVAQGNPVPKIQWIKKSSSGYTFKQDSKTYLNFLVFKNIHHSDGGNYECVSSNIIGEDRVAVLVNVLVSLTVSVNPKLVKVDVGNFVEISCQVTGNPVKTVTWFQNGVTLSTNDEITITPEKLIIKKVLSSSKGIYQCMAKNDDMSSYDVTILKLGDSPPELLSVFQEVTLQPNQHLSLSCLATGSPLPLFTWYLSGVPINKIYSHLDENGFQKSWLNISSVNPSDGGVYTCKAENKFGKVSFSGKVNIYASLLSRPRIQISAVAGENIHLFCPIQGYPVKKYTWKKGNDILPKNHRQAQWSNGTFMIKNVQRIFDSGVYECEAVGNDDISVRGVVDIKVMVPPKITPFFFQEDLVKEGMRARIQCIISEGDFPLAIQWTKDGKDIPVHLGIIVRNLDEYSSILTISNVSPRHNGDYTCTASNDASTTSYTAKLSVNVAPKITPFWFQEDSRIENSFARVTCLVYQGDLPLTLSWLKNGHIINDKDITIRTIDEFSNILTIEKVSRNHTGNYTCIANNTAATATFTAELVVHVPPKIVPFEFQNDHLLDGMLVRVSCVVSHGDLPLNIFWLKDNQFIPVSLKITIRDFDDYSSVLSIDPVTIHHNGNYSCIARNHAGTTIHTTKLIVYVPPHWIISPHDTIGMKGSSLIIHCQADGFPKPVITWKKLIGNEFTNEQVTLIEDYRMKTFENGSLYFKDITEKDEGFYFCYASNGVGVDHSTSLFLKVQAPVYFKEKTSSQMVKIDMPTEMKCEAEGEFPINILWKLNGKIISIKENNRISFSVINKTSHSVLHTLLIYKSSKEDGGIYTCIASNSLGNVSKEISLIIQELPSEPKIIKAKNLGNRTVEISWIKPFDGRSQILNYHLQYKRIQDSWTSRSITLTILSTATTAVVRDLNPATSYEFRLAAKNEIGISEYSETVSVIIEEEAPAGAPEQVEVETVNPSILRISWKPPKKSSWNGVIRGYHIGYRIHGSNNPFSFHTLEVPEDYSSDLIYQLSNLQLYSKYDIVVQAYNSGGKGPSSETIVVMTSEDVPDHPPVDVRCSALSSRSIYVVWDSPPVESINGILLGYTVIYKPLEDWGESRIKSNNTISTKIMLTGLEINTNYSIQVAAYTKVGIGVRNDPVFCKTYEDVPEAPSAIKALPMSENSVLVSWKPPSRFLGSVTKYNIYYTTIGNKEEHRDYSNKALEGVNVHTLESDSTTFEVKNLQNSVHYAFWVTALSSIGEGPISEVITQQSTGREVPAKIASFDDVLRTQWKKDVVLPCKATGNPLPQRTWFQRGRIVSPDDRIVIRFDGTLLIRKVMREDAGNYSCEIRNKLGRDEIIYSLTILVPPDVPMLDVISKTLETIRLHWDSPYDGGEPIQNFVLHYRKQNGLWEKINFNGNIFHHTLENLSCGSSYQMFMEAVNSVGTSKPSETITVNTYSENFQVPPKASIIQEGSTYITVHMDAWPSTVCPVKYFILEYKPFSSSDWIIISNNLKPSQKKLVISSLQPATRYVLRLSAFTNEEDFNIGEYIFATHSLSGAILPSDIMHKEEKVMLFYLNPWIFIPVVILVIICIITAVIVFIYCKRRPTRQRQPLDWTPYSGNLTGTEDIYLSEDNYGNYLKGIGRGTMKRHGTVYYKNPEDENIYATIGRPDSFSQMSQNTVQGNEQTASFDDFSRTAGNNLPISNPFLKPSPSPLQTA